MAHRDEESTELGSSLYANELLLPSARTAPKADGHHPADEGRDAGGFSESAVPHTHQPRASPQRASPDPAKPPLYFEFQIQNGENRTR